jgi:hypothetical protein
MRRPRFRVSRRRSATRIPGRSSSMRARLAIVRSVDESRSGVRSDSSRHFSLSARTRLAVDPVERPAPDGGSAGADDHRLGVVAEVAKSGDGATPRALSHRARRDVWPAVGQVPAMICSSVDARAGRPDVAVCVLLAKISEMSWRRSSVRCFRRDVEHEAILISVL